jgi:hypothetical protein
VYSGQQMLVFEQMNDDGGTEKIALREYDAAHIAIESEEPVVRLEKCFRGKLARVD